jgi:hypothetical protein
MSEGTPRLADLIDEIDKHLCYYVELPSSPLSVLVTCWIVNTYVYECFDYCPYLVLHSSGPGAGKTVVLDFLSMLAFGNPQILTDPSAASLYRCASKVLLLDEMERLGSKDKAVRGNYIEILNSGFKKGGAVSRCDLTKGRGFPTELLSAYGPKAFAGINALNDTLAHRSYMIRMKPVHGKKPRLSLRTFGETAERLRKGLGSWAVRQKGAIEKAYGDLPKEESHPGLSLFDNRYQDISEPLIVLAEVADAERPEGPLVLPRLIEALHVAYRGREKAEKAVLPKELFEIIEARLEGNEQRFVPSAMLLEACHKHEDFRARLKSMRAMANFLKRFGLCPRESPTGKCRGYMLTKEWVDDHRGLVG